MKADISALLDDELDEDEASRVIDALRRDSELLNAWSVYHLIGDTLRNTPSQAPDLTGRVMARLAGEPVVFAPSAPPKRRSLSLALPMAAAVMGMAAVGWVALSLTGPGAVEVAGKAGPSTGQATAVAAQTRPSEAIKEYIVAHQVHAPSGPIRGAAHYVRSVSHIRQGGRP